VSPWQPIVRDAFQHHGWAIALSATNRPFKQDYDLPTVLVVSGAMLAPNYKGGDARILTVIRSLQSLGYGVIYVHLCLDVAIPRHLQELTSTGVKVWGPMTENLQVFKTRLATHRHVTAFEWLWPVPNYLGFLQNFNKLLSTYSPEAAIIPVSDDVMYKRIELEGCSSKTAKSYQIMETFFWKHADVAASINPEIEEEQQLSGAVRTSQLRFCPSTHTF
jgi:hypothetical protein